MTTLEDYVDVRELMPFYYRYDCWQCGHKWVRTHNRKTAVPPKNARCPECGWTQGCEFQEEVLGIDV